MKHYVVEKSISLEGEVVVSGSKNASLPIMAASLLTDEEVVLNNVPVLRDTETMIALLEGLGKRVFWDSWSKNRLIIRSSSNPGVEARYDLVKRMRASIVVLGPLIGKRKQAVVSLPGGCSFGPRPVDLHLKGLELLGANIKLEHGYVKAYVPQKQSLKGANIDLMGRFGPTVLGTDNVVMAASLALGTTTITSAATEPETTDLMRFLTKMGAGIEGVGTSTLVVHGVERLLGAEHTIIDDRIEAGTFLTFAALTKGDVLVRMNNPEHVANFVDFLGQVGVEVVRQPNAVRAKGLGMYRPFDIKTKAYPGFPTDLQSIAMVLGCLASGSSSITETIYPNRYNHVPEMVRMGANISIDGRTATIFGGKRPLQGASVQASDLRSGAALVGAALTAEGKTTLRRIYHIERGYEDFVGKLERLGAHIRLSEDSIV